MATWERMQREFRARTGEEPLSSWSKRQVLLSMLPPQVQEYINVRSLYGQELNYAQIKAATLALVQKTAPNMPAPMDCSVFQQLPPAEAPQQEAAPAQPPPGTGNLDAFGKGPRRDAGGAGGPGGKGSNPDADKVCDTCGRKGHVRRNCWYAEGGKKGPGALPAKKGAGKGGKGGDRQRGGDGRWYKKTINSWELDANQEDDGFGDGGSLEVTGEAEDEYLDISSLEEISEDIGSGQEANQPTDEARPKPVVDLMDIYDEDGSRYGGECKSVTTTTTHTNTHNAHDDHDDDDHDAYDHHARRPQHRMTSGWNSRIPASIMCKLPETVDGQDPLRNYESRDQSNLVPPARIVLGCSVPLGKFHQGRARPYTLARLRTTHDTTITTTTTTVTTI